MNYNELEDIKRTEILGYTLSNISKIDNFIEFTIIDSIESITVIALPIISSGYYKPEKYLEICNKENENIGIIYYSNNQSKIEETEISKELFAALLIDLDYSSFEYSDYKLKSDYLILKSNKYEEYKNKYHKYSSIWGNFFVNDNQFHKPYKKERDKDETGNLKSITAYEVELPTKWHVENMYHSIQQPFAFERFLKKYHLIELLFDYEVVNQIKKLQDDLYGIGKIFQNLNSKEIEHLEYILTLKIIDTFELARKLNNARSYEHKCIEIFYKYGKEGNPSKLDEAKFSQIIAISGLSNIEDLADNDLIPSIKKDISKPNVTSNKIIELKNKQTKEFNKFIIKLTAYWIYRIRCSIAHNKIGEYIMSFQDEEFIVEFAEPIINEILLQCFKKLDL